ncbi:MAG TPA: PTS sugar transporter subunit IIA [Candidatus Paceibacterota bacterium]|nr:PTS sugar transporter subunit IIA [Candidatus Paceibacterota bacterium]
MKLTVRDVSELLDVSEKTVYRWINDRKLPGYRMSGQYRFSRAEVLAWATANKINVSLAALSDVENPNEVLPTLPDALQAGGIFYRIEGNDVASALRNVVEVVRLPDEVDRAFLLEVLLARENLASTAVGDGIAIPHPRTPLVLHVEKPLVCLCFFEHPIDFKALDGQPVQAVFTVVTPTVKSHLHLLSRVAFALRDAEFKALVRAQAGREELLKSVRRLSLELPEAQEKQGR